VVVELLHLVVLPLGWWLFRREPDRGYGIGKILGLVLVAYLSWIVPQTLGLPYRQVTILGMAGLLGLVSLWIFARRRAEIVAALRERRWQILIMELLFAGAFFVFVLFRAWNPEISYDVNLYAAEKFPDMAFYHAICKYDTLPPPDLWFSGPENTINYYYYGYFVQATVTKLAGVDPWIGYNLSLALIFAASVLGAYALLFNLTGRRLPGFLAAIFLNVMGNLYGLVQYLSGKPFGPLELWKGSRIIEKQQLVDGVLKDVDKTINEFPAFSYILGDLHAHLLALPLSLLVIHVLLGLFRVGGSLLERDEGWARRMALAGLFVLSLGTLICGNYWDLPTYLSLSLLMICLLWWQRTDRSLKSLLGWVVLVSAAFPLIRFVLFLPFFLHYSAPPANVKLLDAQHRTLLGQFLTIHGYLLGLVVIYLVVETFQKMAARRGTAFLAGAVGAGVIAGLAFSSPVIGLLVAVLLLAAWQLLLEREDRLRCLPLALIVMASGVLLGCEFIYIKDFYGFPNTRMNTVFKFYYEAWIFLALAAAYGWWVTGRRILALPGVWRIPARGAFELAAVIGLGASLIYPVRAVPVKCDGFEEVLGRPTLNGFAYIRERFPNDYAACVWLRENAEPGAVVVEATGNPYTYYGRVSTMTGLPTILGWGNHESLWRDWTWKLSGERSGDIRRIYKSLDTAEVLRLFEKYDVRYVFVGHLENKDFYEYDLNGLEKFKSIMDPVYDKGGVLIFERRAGLTPETAPPYSRNVRLIIPRDRGKIVVNEEGVREITSKAPIRRVGGAGSDEGRFNSPHDIAVAPDGSFYVADTQNHRIQKFDSQGRFVLAWGAQGTGPGQFNQPTGLALDAEGNVYVADTWNHRIQKFKGNGDFITMIAGPMMFWAPKDLVIDDEGYLYVVDTGYHRIHKFGPDLKEVKVWGRKGSDPGEFFEPVGICLGPRGRLYIADTANKRIVVYDRFGGHLADWYVIGWEEFYTEPFLAYDPGGYILASDSRKNRLQIYGLDGKLLAVWPSPESPAQGFSWPFGIAVDKERRIHVVNGLSNQVLLFSPLELLDEAPGAAGGE
jgi:YYY domain-containing protein